MTQPTTAVTRGRTPHDTTPNSRTIPRQLVDADDWCALAHLSPAVLNQRIQLALSLLSHRFDADDPDVAAVRAALEGPL
jgi:hypothetical protein